MSSEKFRSVEHRALEIMAGRKIGKQTIVNETLTEDAVTGKKVTMEFDPDKPDRRRKKTVVTDRVQFPTPARLASRQRKKAETAEKNAAEASLGIKEETLDEGEIKDLVIKVKEGSATNEEKRKYTALKKGRINAVDTKAFKDALEKINNTDWSDEAADKIRRKDPKYVKWLEKRNKKLTEEITDVYKKGDIVYPTKGPHKGHPHTIIHVYEDNSGYNIRPNGLTPKQNHYHLGAAFAKEDELSTVKKENIELSEKSILTKYYQKKKLANKLKNKKTDAVMRGAAGDPKAKERYSTISSRQKKIGIKEDCEGVARTISRGKEGFVMKDHRIHNQFSKNLLESVKSILKENKTALKDSFREHLLGEHRGDKKKLM